MADKCGRAHTHVTTNNVTEEPRRSDAQWERKCECLHSRMLEVVLAAQLVETSFELVVKVDVVGRPGCLRFSSAVEPKPLKVDPGEGPRG